MGSSLLLFIGIGALGWPLLTYVLWRYQLQLGDGRPLRRAMLAFVLTGLLATGLGDSMISLEHAGRSSAPLYVARGIIFAFPYIALAFWVAYRSILKIRAARSGWPLASYKLRS